MRLHYPSDECRRARLAYWAKERPAVEVDLEGRTEPYLEHIASTAYVNGVRVRAVFDTGAAFSMLSLKAARRAGIAPGSEGVAPGGRARGVGDREVRTWIARVESFALGDEKISHTRLRIGDYDLAVGDMLLGADFFLSHRIYVARSQEKIYFTYNGGPVFGFPASTDDPPGNSPADAGNVATLGGPPEALTADAFARRAAASLARSDFSRALSDLNRACEMEPGDANWRVQRARVRLHLSQQALGLDDLNEAVRLDPASVDARLMRARLRLAMNDAAGAREDLSAADSAAPPQGHVRRDMADLYLALGLPAAAVLQLDPWIAGHGQENDLHEALNARCWARALLGTALDKALADCNAALRARRTSSYLDSRGLVYLRLNRLEAAIDDYDAALKLNPKGAWSLYGRGLARLRSGAREAGLADLDAAKAIDGSVESEASRFGLEP
jgi:tetratricopeptide (TPR) repeat protein